VEWEHLGDWDRKRRILDTLLLSGVVTGLSSIVAALIFALGVAGGGPSAIIAIVPAVAIIGSFVVQVGRSMWRTRL
jgi:hypothetical protein